MSGLTHANKSAAQAPDEKAKRPSRDPTPGAPPHSQRWDPQLRVNSNPLKRWAEFRSPFSALVYVLTAVCARQSEEGFVHDQGSPELPPVIRPGFGTLGALLMAVLGRGGDV